MKIFRVQPIYFICKTLVITHSVLFAFSYAELSFASTGIKSLGPSCYSYYVQALIDRTNLTASNPLKDIDTLLSYGIGQSDPDFQLRRQLVAMTKDPELREGFRAAAYSDLYDRSNQVLSAVEKAAAEDRIDPAAQVFDVLSIGAGPHDAIAMRAILEANPNLKMGTLEASNRVAAVFDKNGFRLNSLSRPGKKGAAPVRGAGNQNELPSGVIQIPDIDSEAYPVAQRLADVTLLNRATVSKAPILFETEVISVRDSAIEGTKWPARYEVTTNRGKFYSNAIINNSGLGRDLNLSRLPRPAQALIEAERVLDPAKNSAPRVQSVAEYFDYVKANPTGFRDYKDESVAFIGAGDSSKTGIEFALGLGPNEAYGKVVAQDGRPQKIFWVGQNKVTCDELLNSLRLRYADIIGGVKSGTVEPVPSQLINVEKLPSGKFKLTFGTASRQGSSASTPTRTVEVDRIIFGTGFQDKSPEVYSPIIAQNRQSIPAGVSFNESPLLIPERGSIPGNRDTVIGKRLTSPFSNSSIPPQQIFFQWTFCRDLG